MMYLKHKMCAGSVAVILFGVVGGTGCNQEPAQAEYQNYCEGKDCSPCEDDSQCYTESDPCSCGLVCSPESKLPTQYPTVVCAEEDRCEPSGQTCRCINSQCQFE